MRKGPYSQTSARRTGRPAVRTLTTALAVTVLALPAVVWTAGPAAGTHLGCGAVITADTVLDSDIGPCSRIGMIIGADNIVLNLNGHTLFGTPNSGELMGILLSDRRGVTVRNGTVKGFDGGVTLSLGGGNTVSKMTIQDNDSGRVGLGSGIAVISSSENLIEKNTLVDNAPFDGVSLERGSRGNVVTKNEIARNGRDGIYVAQAASENLVEKNEVYQNGRTGIHLAGATLRLSFQNLGPTVFDVVLPDRAPYVEGAGYRIMAGSGSGDVTAEIQAVNLTVPPGANPDSSTSGCSTADFAAAGFAAGRVALVQRGACSFQTKVDNAIAAGARAVIIFNEGQAGRTSPPVGLLGFPASVPVLSASYAVGQELNNLLQAGAVAVHVVTNTVSELIEQFPGATGNTLDKNSGHGNAAFDGFDGALNPPCDSNTWIKNSFGTVNQRCVGAG